MVHAAATGEYPREGAPGGKGEDKENCTPYAYGDVVARMRVTA